MTKEDLRASLQAVKQSFAEADKVIEEEEEDLKLGGCGPMARYPVLSIILFAALGVAAGVGLSFWHPEEMEGKIVALRWIGLIGELFVRAIKCVVLLIVFVNVVIAMMEMVMANKAGRIGGLTIGFYLMTTFTAAVFGVMVSLMFQGMYTQGDFAPPEPVLVTLGCNAAGYYMAEGADGNISCAMVDPSSESAKFIIDDISKTFVRVESGARDDLSLSETIYQGVFLGLVTDNIIESFTKTDFGAVVFFAMFFGVALSSFIQKMQKQGVTALAIMSIFKEMDGVLLIMIRWILIITPFAVFSLIAAAVGARSDLQTAFANVGLLVTTTIVGFIFQVVFIYLGVFYLITRKSPIPYLKHILPSPSFAFASQSSAATIPITLKVVKSSGMVSETVANFVVPLGSTVNMDGIAIYFPVAAIWLAFLNGITPNAGQYVLLVIVSVFGSIGAAPVPYANMVLIITAYNSVFGTTGTPEGFEYLMAMDWFVGRLRAALNVTGDAVVCAWISHKCPMDDESDVEEAAAVESAPAAPEEE